ncbi:flagellar basal body P-ring biosynthesis protein FlgA [Alcanivorax xiamenensis]|uniref:Flagella basal body P-ring formation protein FlgA n=1 Tax=Alcanivorax xiamenensis TaxID=1177156 RepID=A0ABQ6Y4G2_9GAMM|nr:flagellar basal body P-ring formation chaperone FlgA [Alcanivorax xiamenensis]KAF0804097.1 flagellar basal body P-ring biosynthesis protein FlgA [Alcanivorax xiamenensis]
MKALRWLVTGLLLTAASLAVAVAPMEQQARAFLLREAARLGDHIEVTMQSPTAPLPQCGDATPFLPGHQRPLLGPVTVGVRCDGQVRYLQARVSARGRYWAAAQNLDAGTILEKDDLRAREGDLSTLPRRTVTDLDQLVGKELTRPLNAGMVLQDSVLRVRPLVRRRQPVKVEAMGTGFRIERAAHALEDGALGERIRVRLPDRRVLTVVVSGPNRTRVTF